MNPSAKSLTVVPAKSHATHVLWVRTAAGPEIGFGHLNRCFTLAKTLQESHTPLFLLDPDDSRTGELITKQGLDYDCSGLEKIWARIPDPEGILIDTRITAGLDDFIAAARSRGVPVISIHDLGLAPVASDIAIDGGIVQVSAQDFPCSRRYCSGPDFMVLDPAYGLLNRNPKKIREKIQSVFINLGGGNSSRYFSVILEGLRRVGHNLEVIGVPGFVSWGQESLGNRDWHPLRFRWESGSIEQFLFQSDLAITAGGISAYEALCTGTPLAALSYDPLQHRTITALAGSGACLDLGPGDLLDPIQVSETVSSIGLDYKKRKSLSVRGRGLVDGRGAERVARLIRQVIGFNLGAEFGRSNVSRTRL